MDTVFPILKPAVLLLALADFLNEIVFHLCIWNSNPDATWLSHNSFVFKPCSIVTGGGVVYLLDSCCLFHSWARSFFNPSAVHLRTKIHGDMRQLCGYFTGLLHYTVLEASFRYDLAESSHWTQLVLFCQAYWILCYIFSFFCFNSCVDWPTVTNAVFFTETWNHRTFWLDSRASWNWPISVKLLFVTKELLYYIVNVILW